VTLRTPIEVKPIILPDGALGYATSGTPADCARLGFTVLANEPVDLVISGVNTDTNLGYDVNYSGTVAAALEAAGAGYPAIAVSIARSTHYDWLGAGAILLDVIDNLADWSIPFGVTLNLNIPSQPKTREPIWARVHSQPAPDYYQKQLRPDGTALYTRLRGDDLRLTLEEPDSDVALSKAGYVTISPLWPVGAHLETLDRLLIKGGSDLNHVKKPF
jgi:5'-nucleotidase